MENQRFNVGIYVYENAEVLDFSGPFEVFSTANRVSDSLDVFNVFLVAEKPQPVKARGGLNIIPNYGFGNHPQIDLLIVVGGIHFEELEKAAVIDWISETAKSAKYVASVCTGVFLLAEAKLLSGLEVTTHWEDIAELERNYPDLTVVSSKRWVDEGKFLTSAGISAGIDMSLYLISKLVSPALAEKTARQMEYVWHQEP